MKPVALVNKKIGRRELPEPCIGTILDNGRFGDSMGYEIVDQSSVRRMNDEERKAWKAYKSDTGVYFVLDRKGLKKLKAMQPKAPEPIEVDLFQM